MNKNLISVIVPMYNASRFIKKCITSILNQTYKNFEVIIINDGSTDNSLNICNRFKDERIRIINQKNQGAIYSRLMGIKEAKGNYICFIDADDWVTKDYLETLVDTAEKHNVDLVCIKDYRTIDKYGIFKVKDFKEIFKEKLYNYNDLKQYNHIYTLNRVFSSTVWGKLYKKELFADYENKILDIIKKIGILFNGEDIMLNLCVTANIKSCYIIDQYKYYYRYGGNTLSKSNYERFWDDNVKLYYGEKMIALKYNDISLIKLSLYNIVNIFKWCIIYRIKFLRLPESQIILFINDVIDSDIYNELTSESGHSKALIKAIKEKNAYEILEIIKSQNKSNIPYYKHKLLNFIFRILN